MEFSLEMLSVIGAVVAVSFGAIGFGQGPARNTIQAWVPSGLISEVTQVTAPPSSSAPGDYRKKPLPTFLLRHRGQTWSNPFVVAYESHTGNPALQSVERLMLRDVFKGVKVTAKVNGQTLIQYVLIQERMDDRVQ